MQLWPGVAFDLLRLNSDWLWEVDADGQLIRWVPTVHAESWPDTAPAEGVRPWQYFLRAERENRAARAELMQKIKNREPLRCARVACWLPHVHVRGWLRVSGVPFFNRSGQFMGYRGAAQNITGQLMTEHKMERLARHNSNLMLAIDASPSIVFMADISKLGWPIIYANPAFAQVAGYQHDDVLGKPALFMAGDCASASDIARLREAIDFRQQVSVNIELQRRDGHSFWASFTLVPGCSCPERCVVVGIIRDITAEMSFQKAEEQRGRLEALGRLAGGMAHEINNLLLPTQLNTEIIADELPKNSEQRIFIDDIKASLEQISFIVKNTLQFARKNEEQKSHPVVPFVPLVSERLDFLRGLLPATIVIERRGFEQVDGKVEINHTEFSQVLTNLATNAAHAMKGKGTLTVQLGKRQLDGVREASFGLPHGSYFTIAVADTGCGMSEEVRQRIFEPFFTTKPVGEGTGLGLSVVYGLVVGWGGHISVHSAPGKGTTFTIFIPEAS